MSRPGFKFLASDRQGRGVLGKVSLSVGQSDGGVRLPTEQFLGDFALLPQPRDAQRLLDFNPFVEQSLLLEQSRGQCIGEVFAPQEAFARRRSNLQRSFEEVDNRDVEGSASQIQHDNNLLLLRFVESVSECGGRWFIDDSFDLQTGEFTRLHRRAALMFIEVGRNRNDGTADRFSQLRFGVAFDCSQNKAGERHSREFAAGQLTGPVGSHLSLEGGGASFGLEHLQFASDLPHGNFAAFLNTDDRRDEILAERAGQ